MKQVQYINPVIQLGGQLLDVEKPARYTGGEIGCLAKERDKRTNNILRTLIAFPDLYEIGMTNQAVRIIYNRLNNIEGISCDRSFAPAPDFEKLLRDKKLPLYGLDTGISLASVDILMFTLGYELGLNGILTMLDVCQIPLRCKERKNDYPIIIAGGPAVSNPLPYSPYIDAFWIGEAEAGFFELAAELSILKREGQGSQALFEKIASHPNIWVKGKQKAKRAIAFNFCNESTDVYPIPSMKIIQHHGTVEIMRGCPNGCRFCHAGFWYRPAREKPLEKILSEVSQLVTKGGWQEISLSSLSSGDYSCIDELMEDLNDSFKDLHVSFQLPSLKVSSFSLSLFKKISVTRKSGLTFAVETPMDMWQLAINKEVTRDSVVSIIEETKKYGWKSAKFYFMIGLPVESNEYSEEEEIVSFITEVGRRTRMHFNINVGIYIPKPHTPYQSVSQIINETADKKLLFIKTKLKPLGHKVGISDLLISQIEGVLSRGDERSGFLCEEAWRNGSRLDPWTDFINKEKWIEILEKNSDYIEHIFSNQNVPLPWSCIDPCIKGEYLNQEFEKSKRFIRTPSCKEKCNLCGVCDKKIKIISNIASIKKNVNLVGNTVNDIPIKKSDPDIYRILFSFSKEGSVVFHGHLSLIEIFSMSFKRAGIPVMYTQGFNPLVKMEFASPLTTGISACMEIAVVNFLNEFPSDTFIDNLNNNLPDGIRIKNAAGFLIKSGMKKHSLSSLLWGFSYLNKEAIDFVNAKEDKVYRQSRLGKDCSSLFDLVRKEVLAKSINNSECEYASYFDVYKELYY